MGPKVLWSFLGTSVTSPQVDGSGNVYFGSLEHAVYSLTPSGEVRWRFVLEGQDNYPRGIAVGPDELVYISTAYTLYALDGGGNMRWKLSVPRIDSAVADAEGGSPLAGPDGTVYLAFSVYGQRKVGLWAIGPDGKIRWQFVGAAARGQETAYLGMGPKGTLYLGARGGSLYAIQPDGTLIWELPPKGYYGIYDSPTISADGTVYVITEAPGLLLAISPDGSEKWRSDIETYHAAAIGADGTIYVGGNAYVHPFSGPGHNHFFALSPAGETEWLFDIYGGTMTPAVISADGTIYFAVYSSGIYALNKDGSLKWNYQVWASGDEVVGQAISRDAMLYAASEDGNLYAISLTEQEALAAPLPPWNAAPGASAGIVGWRVVAGDRPYLQVKLSAADTSPWFLVDPRGNKGELTYFADYKGWLEFPMGYGSPPAGRYILMKQSYGAEAKEQMSLDFTGAKLSVVSVRGAGSNVYVEVRNTGDLPAVINTVNVKFQGSPDYLSWPFSDDLSSFAVYNGGRVMPGRTALASGIRGGAQQQGPLWAEPGTPIDVSLGYVDWGAGGGMGLTRTEVALLEQKAILAPLLFPRGK
ncbi:MAG: PQQ-like beta-propeller repeat protein [Chloroflexi bacterium]|nr:PQQ-like beta-propeller repeat protein [Chloroflexota bacterium]